MFFLMMSTSWRLSPSIIVNSTPFFLLATTFVCGFWNNFQGSRETCAQLFVSSISSKQLNELARLIHHKKILYGLTRPSLSRCDLLCRLKLFPEKESLLQLLFGRLSESKYEREKLLLFDNHGKDSCIKTPDTTDNRAFGLVNINNDYPNGRAEYQTQKCRTLIIYNNNNNNNNHSRCGVVVGALLSSEES